MKARLLLALFVTWACSAVFAEDGNRQREAGFGGPNAVGNQIESDREQTLLGRGIAFGESWDAWKAALQEDHGFVLGGDYTGVWLNASETVPGGRC